MGSGPGPVQTEPIPLSPEDEGRMLFFPAWLKHWVSPFRSDVTRISVSGNVHDKVSISVLPDNLKIEQKE